jgi:uncharacterized protein YggL (DUF469 family)
MVILAAFLITIGCNGQLNPSDHEGFVSIATVGGLDNETQEIIRADLAAKQIECYFDGSVLYDLYVKKKDTSSAIKVIKKSKKLEGRNIEFR